ncbi:MAG: hypothetical protein IJR68_12940 [Fretibacterium sp.]|nr:hypothetical protein [Fretibacterium sp.]
MADSTVLVADRFRIAQLDPLIAFLTLNVRPIEAARADVMTLHISGHFAAEIILPAIITVGIVRIQTIFTDQDFVAISSMGTVWLPIVEIAIAAFAAALVEVFTVVTVQASANFITTDNTET